mmetsp:Transcript_12185/g.35905  ORF Transcript_12185/g.35905 Transcript_12185/m.35905 type:complete len:270 (+) Transcript_12185:226-1035(+)
MVPPNLRPRGVGRDHLSELRLASGEEHGAASRPQDAPPLSQRRGIQPLPPTVLPPERQVAQHGVHAAVVKRQPRRIGVHQQQRQRPLPGCGIGVGRRALQLGGVPIAPDTRGQRLQPSGFEEDARSPTHRVEDSAARPQLGERRERPPYRRVQRGSDTVAPRAQPASREPAALCVGGELDDDLRAAPLQKYLERVAARRGAEASPPGRGSVMPSLGQHPPKLLPCHAASILRAATPRCHAKGDAAGLSSLGGSCRHTIDCGSPGLLQRR